MPLLRTLIVDDEPLARAGLSDYVGRVDFLTEVGQARDGMAALTRLETGDVDLLLLDVQMPRLSGTELLRSLARPPAVVFTTAHPGFAVEGFDLDAVDYLLKPVSFPRFLRAMLKVRDRLSAAGTAVIAPAPAPAPAPTPTSEPATDLFIREEGRVERLLLDDILYAESMQNYCRIHTTGGTYLPLLPLKELLAALPPERFVQIHRSYLVRLGAVAALDGNQVRIGETLLPVSRSRREGVARRFLGG